MKALVTGSTGFVGTHLMRRLDQPIAVGRSLEKIRQRFGDVEMRLWDPDRSVEPSLLAGVDTVFHLVGESVFNGRWNAAKKEKIRTSRVDSTRRLVDGIASCAHPPKTLICSSAIGFYGDRGAEKLTEGAAPGHDFLAGVCEAWEDEALRAQRFGVRVVCVRTGVVLGRGGGALAQMLPLFRMGLGGRLGNGHQYMSWVHIDDLVGIMLYAARQAEINGPVNGVAPEPVTNRAFTVTLARVLHRPAFFPIPRFILKLILGEFATVLLSSQRVLPEKISQAGYRFIFAELKDGLDDLL